MRVANDHRQIKMSCSSSRNETEILRAEVIAERHDLLSKAENCWRL